MRATIRPPRPTDASAIADVHVAAWRETYSHLLPADFFSPEYIAGRQRLWKHVLAERRDDMAIRVAEIDGDIIGFAWLGPSEGHDAEAPPRDRLLYGARRRGPRSITSGGGSFWYFSVRRLS
ncbi:hypothetical protein [Microbacterium invictum]|uniref:N-acetyltransferase domain-containing protein n=1 Tax=Microbacterium invictum TaxID=515415 RepID=A0ABZ0V9Q5_9MICO|nr:hypothetical protein [Microbacterium invictum]WQB70343.1 hypothetical protein T9R20_16855 [Microbacterium invictum]